MCGIVGLLDLGDAAPDVLANIAGRMCDTLVHRGPDDAGVWVDGRAGIVLAHRRLSIVDLSSMGHQPMLSSCGRYVIAFNGEIYNHRSLRAEVSRTSAYPWRGQSDTETFLGAIATWGIPRALEQSVGMFAFAVWDRRNRTLTLGRDRMGEKPLYYGWIGNTFAFASELKAFKAHPRFAGEIDPQAVALYVRFNYVPTPWSIYQGVRKLPPGTVLEVLAERRRGTVSPLPYWSARDVAMQGLNVPFEGNEEDAVNRLEQLLRQSIAGQMVADVPVGAFLSGGIDSSAVVALMQAQASRPVRTFSIGFFEDGYNEAHYARDVATHLRTDHVELYVTAEQALDVVPKLPSLYDEPFGDASQIPTCLITMLARKYVTVALSGDGGDELFGGYNRYFWAMRVAGHTGRTPTYVQRGAAALITLLSAQSWDRLFGLIRPVVPKSLRYGSAGDKLHKLATILRAGTPDGIYRELVSQWSSRALMPGALEPATPVTDPQLSLRHPDFPQRMMFLDQITYLTDDILVKVDRAAMGVSLETRIPLLDHRLVEFAWRVPLAMKIKGSRGKWLLRRLLHRYVPVELVERPKMGFGAPIDSWLRGPLREWAEALLTERRLRQDGYFDPKPIRRRWEEHISGRANWQYPLWDILMFQAWHEEHERQLAPPPARSMVSSARDPANVIFAEAAPVA